MKEPHTAISHWESKNKIWEVTHEIIVLCGTVTCSAGGFVIILVFITDATDIMHGNAFKNANTFNNQETGFVDQVDQDSISKILTDRMKN